MKPPLCSLGRRHVHLLLAPVNMHPPHRGTFLAGPMLFPKKARLGDCLAQSDARQPSSVRLGHTSLNGIQRRTVQYKYRWDALLILQVIAQGSGWLPRSAWHTVPLDLYKTVSWHFYSID